MKKIIFFLVIFFSVFSNVNSKEIKRITVGNKDAKVTIIAFESLTCSHCANFHKNVYPELKRDFLDTGLVKIEFRNFPLDIAAFNASKLAHCRNDGKPEILEYLYENQKKWFGDAGTIPEINENLIKFSKENMLFYNIRFDDCLEDKMIEDFILNDRIDGAKNFKVNATPTIIINNEKFEQTLNYKNLKKALEKMI